GRAATRGSHLRRLDGPGPRDRLPRPAGEHRPRPGRLSQRGRAARRPGPGADVPRGHPACQTGTGPRIPDPPLGPPRPPDHGPDAHERDPALTHATTEPAVTRPASRTRSDDLTTMPSTDASTPPAPAQPTAPD